MNKDIDHPDYDKLLTIEKSARRASKLSKRLLVFGYEMENRFEPVYLKSLVEQVSKILERTIPKMIHIELDLENNKDIVSADPGQIEQVIMNLAVNARDAMPDGGKLTFMTKSVILDEVFCYTHPGCIPGRYVLLAITDEGIGMDGETLEKIFKPFFTTKKKGEGTGLGLAMVYGIIKSHRGFIECSSKYGQGTTFRIYIPIVESDNDIELINEEAADSYSPERGNETILIVDDEDTNRDIAREILTDFGYHVITAPDCESAFAYYKRHMKKVDLVILDLIMPGMGGKKLLEELLRINPSVRVIVSSGYTTKETTRETMETGAIDFISKPYDVKMMLKTVRRALRQEI
jgi:CheY-like chemotaxis protein